MNLQFHRSVKIEPGTAEDMFKSLYLAPCQQAVEPAPLEAESRKIRDVVDELRELIPSLPAERRAKLNSEFKYWHGLWRNFADERAALMLHYILDRCKVDWRLLPRMQLRFPGESQEAWLDRCYEQSGYVFPRIDKWPDKETK